MSAVTYGETYVAADAKAAAPRRGFFARMMDRLIEVRMQQAAREVELHLGYLPVAMDRRRNRQAQTDI